MGSDRLEVSTSFAASQISACEHLAVVVRALRGRAADPQSSQCGRFLAPLIGACGSWVSLPEMLTPRIAQYNERVLELRCMGFHTESRVEDRDGTRCSSFRLISGLAVQTGAGESPTCAESGSLFGDLSPQRYPD
jgi:hypothetical protein